MGLKVNTIITLENKEKFIVLDEVSYEGVKYFMVMGVNDIKEIIPSKVNILKEVIVGNDTYITKIKNEEDILKYTKMFKNKN